MSCSKSLYKFDKIKTGHSFLFQLFRFFLSGDMHFLTAQKTSFIQKTIKTCSYKLRKSVLFSPMNFIRVLPI